MPGIPGSKEVVSTLRRLSQTNLQHKATAFQQILRYGGIKTIGNLLASRKGVFGMIVIGLSYWLLLGRLPAEAPLDMVAQMGEVAVRAAAQDLAAGHNRPKTQSRPDRERA